MHRHLTHDKCYASYHAFCGAMLDFRRDEVPAGWNTFRDAVSDNFRVIAPTDFRVLS
jgi:hypothetical protein